MIQEGIAVDPLLARAGWTLAMLVWCGRRATTLVAAGHKYIKAISTKQKNTWIPAQKHYRDDVRVGATRRLLAIICSYMS
ncbi:hypothetical protein EGC86_09915 [Shewanella frigidimarina]|nr:hypothetical protein EGC86_09915 [Shewanella frigidimarina]